MAKLFLHTKNLNLRHITFLILLFLLSTSDSLAQVKFYALTDAQEILAGSYVEVEFVLENSDFNNFTPPKFTGFKVISGPNTYHSSENINGAQFSKSTISYTLLAIKPGIFTIPPVKITIRNKIYKTKPVTIKVLDKNKLPSSKPDTDIFANMEISDSSVYTGQALYIKYNLYTNKNILDYNFESKPDFPWAEAYKINNDQRKQRKIIGNKEYTYFTIKEFVIFPKESGSFNIPPAYIDIKIPDNHRRSFFYNSYKSIKIHTNTKSIKVLPLPDNTPSNFSGNTGKFKIHAKINKKHVSTDDAFSLKLQITGTVPSSYIEAPKINEYLKDFEIYDPKIISQNNYIQNKILQSKKIFEYLIVPLKPGKYTIKIPYTYFDSDSAKYTTIYSNPLSITITKGKNNQDSKTIIEKYKLRPLMPNTSLTKKKAPFFGSFVFWSILGFLLLSIIVMYFYKRYLIKQSKIDPVQLKRKKAAKIALNRLKVAKKYMNENKISAFYKEISDALLKYVADKLNIPTIELSKENVSSKLQYLKVSQEYIEDFIKILETSEIALYAANPDKNMQDIYNRAIELLTKMEASI